MACLTACRILKRSGGLLQRFIRQSGPKTGLPRVALLSTDAAKELNRHGRLDLAVAYRALERFGLNEGVCNHCTLVVPPANGDADRVMLLVPYGTHWSRVKASSLLALDDKDRVVEGKGKAEITAACIHRAVHNVREDAKCVIHLHATYSSAVAALEDMRLQMVHQNSCRFYRGVAYDENYSGLATDMEEGDRIARAMGQSNVLLMKNHGFMVTGDTVAEAFDRAYYLERACQIQMLAMACGKPLSIISDEVAASTYQVFQREVPDYSRDHFLAVMECIMSETPEVAC